MHWRDIAAKVEARRLFSGLAPLAVLQTVLILELSVQTDFFSYQRLDLAGIALSLLRTASHYAVGLLLPLPIVVGLYNLIPRVGRARFAWLALLAACYASLAVVLDPITNQELAIPAFAILILVVQEFSQRAAVSESSLLRAQIAERALDAEVTRSQLQLLRSQAEPHFLFNTLANVRRLAQQDTGAAGVMIANFMRYLEAALPSLRNEWLTLQEERSLLEAYLGIHQVRMGDRLRYTLHIPAELGDARIPSMMLLTLVENAIKHGLAPLPEGGDIEISAHRDGGTLHVCVRDSGRGMQATTGSGMGLVNIRARLALLYGPSAALSLQSLQPRGLAARIALPLTEPA